MVSLSGLMGLSAQILIFWRLYQHTIMHHYRYSDPSPIIIKDLMQKYGGKYEHFFRAKRGITHVITNSFPDCKVDVFKFVTCSLSLHCDVLSHGFIIQRNLKVVKPSWVTDSIKAQRRLPEEHYQVRNPGRRNKTEIFGTELVTQADQESSDTQEQATPDDEGKVPGLSEDKELHREEQVRHDCTSPEFLQHYFGASRLHHLSSWKQQWQQELSAFLLKEDQEKKEAEEALNKEQEQVVFGEHMKRTETIIMHIDIDCFFVSVTVREHPELRGLPVVVCHGSGETSEIACASYEARQYGLLRATHEIHASCSVM